MGERERDRGEREGRERYLGGEEAEVGEAVGQRRGGEVADGRGLRALLQAGLGQAVAVGLIRMAAQTAVREEGVRRGRNGRGAWYASHKGPLRNRRKLKRVHAKRRPHLRKERGRGMGSAAPSASSPV